MRKFCVWEDMVAIVFNMHNEVFVVGKKKNKQQNKQQNNKHVSTSLCTLHFGYQICM